MHQVKKLKSRSDFLTVYSGNIKINTQGEIDIIDITENIKKEIGKSKIKNGIICVFNP